MGAERGAGRAVQVQDCSLPRFSSSDKLLPRFADCLNPPLRSGPASNNDTLSMEGSERVSYVLREI